MQDRNETSTATGLSLTRLMGEFRAGKQEAAGELVDLMYAELRRLAASMMRGERQDHSWQPTLLVNELYLELSKIKGLRERPANQQEREAFLALAAHIMRRLLIHHARPLSKRVQKVELDPEASSPMPGAEALTYVDNLLSRLAEVEPKFRTVVEMKVFEGKTQAEIAAVLGCAERTVASYWNFCRHWLEAEMKM